MTRAVWAYRETVAMLVTFCRTHIGSILSWFPKAATWFFYGHGRMPMKGQSFLELDQSF